MMKKIGYYLYGGKSLFVAVRAHGFIDRKGVNQPCNHHHVMDCFHT